MPEDKVNTCSLEDLVGTLKSSIISANKAVQHQYAYILESFFDYDQDKDVYTPKYVSLKTPQNTDMKVALITLMNPTIFSTKNVKMAFSVLLSEIDKQDIINAQNDQANANNDLSLKVSLSPQGKVLNEQRFPNEVEIEIEMESQPCSEGVSRIIDRYLSGIALG